jgi:hypothetical protein
VFQAGIGSLTHFMWTMDKTRMISDVLAIVFSEDRHLRLWRDPADLIWNPRGKPAMDRGHCVPRKAVPRSTALIRWPVV